MRRHIMHSLHTCDYHIHTHFSTDSKERAVSHIEHAIQKGLTEICFTDHMDLLFPEPDQFIFNADDYFKELLPLQEAYADKLTIKIGVELGLQPSIAPTLIECIQKHPYDFVIGSVHLIDKVDPYYSAFWESIQGKDGMRLYFEEILQTLRDSVALDSYFDVYGHLDYICRYLPQGQTYFAHDYRDILDIILNLLIYQGKGIEVNTAGYRTQDAPNPHPMIIKRYKELGGEIITIGSDAHIASNIGNHFEKIPELLLSCGFNYYATYKKRVVTFHPINK